MVPALEARGFAQGRAQHLQRSRIPHWPMTQTILEVPTSSAETSPVPVGGDFIVHAQFRSVSPITCLCLFRYGVLLLAALQARRSNVWATARSISVTSRSRIPLVDDEVFQCIQLRLPAGFRQLDHDAVARGSGSSGGRTGAFVGGDARGAGAVGLDGVHQVGGAGRGARRPPAWAGGRNFSTFCGW